MEDDISIETESVYEFELTNNISLFHEEESNSWYAAKTGFEIIGEENIIVLEDEEFEMEDEVDVFGLSFTKDMLEEYKQIVEEDKGEIE